MKSFEQLAESAFNAYRKSLHCGLHQAPLVSTYSQLTDESKSHWVAVAKQVVAEIAVTELSIDGG